MAAPPSILNSILTSAVAALTPIATPSTNWLTTPETPVVGPPSDTISNDALTRPKLFVAFANEQPASTALNRHGWTATFNIFCVAATTQVCLDLKADVMRALYAAESTFTTSYGQPLTPVSFVIRDDPRDVGMFVGLLTATLEYSTDHLTA